MHTVVTVKDAVTGATIGTLTSDSENPVFVQTDLEIAGVNTSAKVDARLDGFARATISRTGETDEVIEKAPLI